MATQPTPYRMVLRDLLCFAIKKYSRVDEKNLKTGIIDFYSVDEVAIVEELLSDEIEAAQDNVKIQRCSLRRKNSLNCPPTEVDDVLLLIKWCDIDSGLDIVTKQNVEEYAQKWKTGKF